jgi:dipeptidyl aminopeptidase/acylaminoacyl peptidase
MINNLFDLNIDSAILNSAENESALVNCLFKAPKIFEFNTPDNCKLYGMIYFPFNFKEGEQYPTLLYVYGGPHAQMVNNSYKINKYILVFLTFINF